MDRNLLFTIERMKEGDIAGPELYQGPDGKRAYRLVKLVKQTDPHVANIRDDYNRLQESAKRRKQNITLEQWINEHRNSAYIWVDEEYAGCKFNTKWEIAKR